MSVEKYFAFNFVNGLSGDPAIYVQNKKSGKAFLWDMAPLHNLSEKEQLKMKRVLFLILIWIISWVLIAGFVSTYLTNVLFISMAQKELAKRITNRLNSYVWNLIDIILVYYFVTEITDEEVRKFKELAWIRRPESFM